MAVMTRAMTLYVSAPGKQVGLDIRWGIIDRALLVDDFDRTFFNLVCDILKHSFGKLE